MKHPECVNHKVKIAPHDYSKEKFLATFTLQKQLTPEQIFWSQDLIKMKSKALKEQTTSSRPIKASMVKLNEVERKNLLIANDNLIAECLSKEVFSVATNSELNVARFTKMHVANTIVETRCLELEAELSNLRDKSHNDNHDENNKEPHLDYLMNLKESVETIRDMVEEAKVVRPLDSSIVSACRYTKHSQELLEYAIGVNRCTDASESKPRGNTKKNKISPAKGVNKMQVEEHPRTNKSHLRTSNRVDSSSRPKRTVIGDIIISRVYYVEGLRHNLFFVGQFCDVDLEVAFRKHSCYVRDTDGIELIKGSRGSNLYTISIEDMMKSSPICLLSKASKNKSWL
nr:integrase, catalytic region, zinc finger, CCHC-type, peptidase aspartic, catalytic [Tanacetum cinerariifolium]